MRSALLQFLAVVFIAVSVLSISAQAQPVSGAVQFDFGPAGNSPASGFVRIDPSTRYSQDQGFGLLTDSLTSVDRAILGKALGSQAADGLAKEGTVEFRVDLPKGKYAVEVVMDGGSLETWRGEISINGYVVASTLESFGYSAESTYAPPFWSCLRLFEIKTDHLVLRVRASGQRTTVNSVSFYPYAEGPVRFVDGLFLRTASAKAPNIDLALRLINAGMATEAARIIDAIPTEWSVDRAYLLMALASRLETQMPRQLVESAAALLAGAYARTQDQTLRLQMRLAQLYLTADQHYRQAGWQWAKDLYGLGIFGNCEVSANSSAEITAIADHPLWLASVWHLARTCYGLMLEQHVPRMVVRSDSLLKLVRRFNPNHPLIAAYLAEIPQPEEPGQQWSGAPRWALYQNSLANRLKAIIHYWCESRQAANGEFGGKYDDDVELLRWWPFARIAIDDSVTLVGLRRLADGIWNSDWIANGWCKQVRDVEHSSEPVADTQPMMIAFEYGSPVYIERCMQSAKLALDLWTAKNAKGHRHFRSGWYSSTEVDTKAPKDCDVPYNTRTVKAIRWFAWYTRHPEALRFLREWSDAWLDDCMRTEKGKPAGIVPAAIRFSDDAIGGHADNWHHPGLFWAYFDYDGESDMLMEFLSSYQLFGDSRYLKPIELSLQLVQRDAAGGSRADSIGSEAWAASRLRGSDEFWEVVELWRLLTGDKRYDALLLTHGSPYLKFRLTASTAALEERLADVLRDIDRNYSLITTEGYFTDRISIRNVPGRRDNGASLLESMYLGGSLASIFYPSSTVFWKGTDSTFSALVEDATSKVARIRVFSCSAIPVTGTATFLQLEPGEYEITQGMDRNNDGEVEEVRKRETVMLVQRNESHTFTFAPREEEIIVVRQKKEGTRGPAMCDLAVANAELRTARLPGGGVNVSLPVHNIGTVDAKNITVELVSGTENPTVLQRVSIAQIQAPLDLLPRQETVTFTIPYRPGRYAIRVQGEDGVPEITRVNNATAFVL